MTTACSVFFIEVVSISFYTQDGVQNDADWMSLSTNRIDAN